MQTTPTAKPLLIVTVGPPGSGKSFFARQFAETFNAPLISFDEIRSELFNDISYTADEDIIVARIAGLHLRELFKTKKTIVIDGGHNPKVSRMELSKIARTQGYSVLNIWVQTDERTARTRATRRSSKNSFDVYNRALSDQEFEIHAKKFTPPSQQEVFVVISGRHTYAAQARTVLKKMVVPHEAPKVTPQQRPQPQQPNPGRRTLSIN